MYIFLDSSVNKNMKSKIILIWFRLSVIIYKRKLTRLVLYPFLLFYRVIVEWFIGCELNWKLKVGRLRLYHGQGLVINPEAVIGNDCTLRCNTVIGSKSGTAAPRIGNNVDVGANVCIIGDISIGDNVVIGAGSVVVKSVPKTL